MGAVAAEDRRALFEIALVLAIALGAVAGALVIATGLPLTAIAVGGAAVYGVAFAVIALLV